MSIPRTALSAGIVVRDMLLADEEVTSRTTRIFPIVIDEAKTPYILYRRASLQHNPTKSGSPGADTIIMEVECYTSNYAEGIELAEAVRRALDYKQGEKDGTKIRSCVFDGSEEGWENDAYIQHLDFTIKF